MPPDPSQPGRRARASTLQGRARPARSGAAGRRANVFLTVLSFALIGVLPLLLYAFLVTGIPTISAPAARRRLEAKPATSALVDVRTARAFALGHAPGAYNWPYADLQRRQPNDPLPAAFRERQLLVISASGLRSALATRRLRAQSLPAAHIHGGMQAWIATAAASGGPVLEATSGAPLLQPIRFLSPFEQMATVTASLVIKPLYMIAALLLIVLLWRRRDTDLLLLRWGLIFFLAGETACIFNTIAFFLGGEQSDLFEYLHGLGMTLCLGLLFFALSVGLDRRLLHLSDPSRRCALLPLCRGCIKLQGTACRLQRTFLLLLPLAGALCLVPLSAQVDAVSFNATLFGLPYNFTHPGIHQFYEIRYLPLVTIFLLALSFLLLRRPHPDAFARARIPFAAAGGALSYSLLMLALHAIFRHNLVWFVFWEEATELLLIGAIAALLWIFRRAFFPEGVHRFSF